MLKNYIKYLVSHNVQFYMYIKLDKTKWSMCAYVVSNMIECKTRDVCKALTSRPF